MREAHRTRAGQLERLEPLERLAHPRRLRRHLGRALGWLGWLVAGALGLVLIDRPVELDCARALRTQVPGVAMAVCQREYRELHHPATGVRLANLLRQDGQREPARTLANQLLDSQERASAFQILGKLADDEDRPDAAASFLGAALTLHRAEHDPSGVARDDQALAKVQADRHQFSDALVTLDGCLRAAIEAGDRQIEHYCRLSAVRVLSAVGEFELAQRELDRATRLATTDRDRAWLQYQQGNLDQEFERSPQVVDHDQRAIEAFLQTLALNARAQVPGLALTVELNLAYTFAEAGRIDDAERHLELARLLDVENEKVIQRTAIAARIAYRRGDPVLAASLNAQVYPRIDDADDRIEVAVMQARIALGSGELAQAADWARRGIDDVENIRGSESVLELRSPVLSSRRRPYELLFVALARAGRFEDAVTVLDQWQGRTLLDALAAPGPRSNGPGDGLVGVARRVANLGTWLPAVSTAPPGKAGDRRAVLETLRTTDLLALVVAEHDVWRVTASQGRLDIAALGPLSRLQDRLDRFRAAPTDPALAAELGELFLPDATIRTTPAALHVLLDGPLAALPVVALRRAGRPLIAARPVVRVFRIPAVPCVVTGARTRVSVIADPGSDLPDARQEAGELAAMRGLEIAPAVGAQATSAALFAAARSDVLHVAMHAAIEAGGGALELHDREVLGLEISARKLGPSLVVLSACGSASADDVELAGSLAMAFLAAGSAQVVATLRPVTDTGARQLTRRFYAAGGVTDPVRALASIQTELATTADTDWPSFAVFGHDVCSH